MNNWFERRLQEEAGDAEGGGGLPAPTSTESSAPAPVVSTHMPDDSDTLSDMLDFRTPKSGTVPTSTSVPTPSTQVVPVPVVTAQPPAPVPQSAQQVPAQQVQQAPPQQFAPQQDPGEQAQRYQATRAAAIPQIASRYQFTPEQKMALLTEPETVLPTMAAQIMVDAYESAVGVISQMLPGLIQSISRESNVVQSREEQFWKANPDLRDKPVDIVAQVAQTYLRVNPQVSAEKADREIGTLVRQLLGIAPLTPTTPPASVANPLVARTPLGVAAMGAPPALSEQDAVLADMLGWRRN